MATIITITKECGRCGGDGQFPNPDNDPVSGDLVEPESTIDCTLCLGTGVKTKFTFDGSLLDDIFDKVNDVKEKVDEIKEVVDEL